MMITSYNPKQIGDVLIVVLGQDKGAQTHEKKNDIVAIKNEDGNVIGYNIFNVSEIIPEIKNENGQVHLTEAQTDKLNAAIKDAGFDAELPTNVPSKFVVGFVKSMKEHPKSSHLHITETEVEDGKTLQIVSSSPNMQEGIKVVVAEVGAMMPNGLIIWPSELKEVESDGMICSGRELKIPNAPDRPGALILPDTYTVGEPFDFDKAKTLFDE
ncbi:YtpR family tRNA-binding protein [Fructilactobacillus sp. Tb1]|uniref:YtpR family tRNA-binding protein n=1 Tax=Fructilactobacillus sp. Tb1 TaxID=3422304 RepID=UPI003D2A0754